MIKCYEYFLQGSHFDIIDCGARASLNGETKSKYVRFGIY